MAIAVRLWVIVGLTVAGFAIAFVTEITQLSTDTMQARQAKVRNVIEAASGTVGHFTALAEKGEMTREQAQASAIGAIKAMRYDGTEYVWINSLDGLMVMHPTNPKLEGQELFGLKDPTGKLFFKEMVDVVRAKGEGVVEYMWPKPGSDQPVPKVSYVKGVPGWNWLLGSGVYVDDVAVAVRERAITRGLQTALGIVLLTLAVVVIARSISNPLKRLTVTMNELSHGRLDIAVPDLDKGAEIGAMAQSIAVFKDNAVAMRRMQEERAEAEQQVEAERRALRLKMAGDFEASVKHVVSMVGQSAQALKGTAQAMSDNADDTAGKSQAVAVAAEQATANVQTVAVATEELSASIQEISCQVHRSASIAQNAVEAAERTNDTVRGLAEAAGRIGQVVGMINTIASQTNLLALNATIEAARAGDAGKGFAVVANEVKSLANQTAKATDEIVAQVQAVQAATGDAVKAIGEISHVIAEINEISGSIAAAIEEQGAATQEISRNTQQAAQGTQNVSDNVTGVRQVADETGRSAGNLLDQAQNLSAEAGQLSTAVDRFLSEVRAA
ncbi:cache domain-containing protein [Magnetospirillum sp. J10]|uniref:Cache domain-containing protein n=2 Tax=Magnetospirillum sulfuroxidans TaxID=611300 RepID=A0ABS5IBE1_9PROT|nr:cache domain-containing protein [Magnetospirillum sulfuroxidans]